MERKNPHQLPDAGGWVETFSFNYNFTKRLTAIDVPLLILIW